MDTPTVFISYSWTSKEYEMRILKLAEDLTSQGVKVIFDKWDLREGHDANAFMEKMVNDPEISKVIIACDQAYMTKANSRKRGVGTEAQIISTEIYQKQEQNKFLAVVFEKDGDGQACTPTYYGSRIYIDMADPEEEAAQFETLVRWLFNKPLYIRPSVGEPPLYLTEEKASIKIPTRVKLKRALEAIRSGRSNFLGATTEYLDELVTGFESFRPDTSAEPFDEEVVVSIEKFIPYRNEYISLVEALARYTEDDAFIDEIKTFFEKMHVYTYRPDHIRSWNEEHWDVFKFIFHELFLYTTSILITRKRFSCVQQLINGNYLVKDSYGNMALKDISAFRNPIQSLNRRNTRLKLERLSLQADLLKERCTGTSVNFNELMQADFTLYISRLIHDTDNHWLGWFPITNLYTTFDHSGFELFIRCESSKEFNNLKTLLGIESKTPIDRIVSEVKSDKDKIPNFNSFRGRVPVLALLNYEKLDTKP